MALDTVSEKNYNAWNTYSIRETRAIGGGRDEENNYTIYRLYNDPPNNISELDALTRFTHSGISVRGNRVDGHWIIEQSFVHGRNNIERVPVGIAHSEEELPDRTYELAKSIAQRLAERKGFKFRDLTKRVQENSK